MASYEEKRETKGLESTNPWQWIESSDLNVVIFSIYPSFSVSALFKTPMHSFSDVYDPPVVMITQNN